uniref:type I methionyl aminopeptidase n=1 Tax=Ndongobacter massiliensis TaxID=1871025 RepID=UPI0009307632|nr:type I methionyl aminopeptidase [Ndongobacter massiliensis]
MIRISTEEQIAGMKRSGRILTKTHHAIRRVLRPGITTAQLDRFAEAFMRWKGAIPAQKGYQDFPFALCTSVNDEVCHGFPNDRPLQEGDILSVDNVVNYEGYLSDSCWSYAVGELSPADRELMDVTYEALLRGMAAVKSGHRLVEIGKAIQPFVESHGFSVVRDFVGHGIGEAMHEDPQVLHYIGRSRGPRLPENLVMTIEPMINAGTWHVVLDENGWTARTADGKKSCQFEHTFAVRQDGVEILTDQRDTFLEEEEIAWIDAWQW